MLRIYIIIQLIKLDERENWEAAVPTYYLSLFRMGLFGASRGWGAKSPPPPLKSIAHFLEWWNLRCTLSKEDPKNI